ncbi:MAG: type I glutamate--ammonia ligase [Candidatus Zixiibacteriota bacterium]
MKSEVRLQKLDKLKKMARESNIEYVDLKFSDLLGVWHHLTIPVSSMTDDLFESGVGVDGSSLPGFASIEKGDMILLPDPSTAFIDRFFERTTLSLLGDIMEVGTDIVPYSRNPRRVTADAEKYLKKVIPGSSIIVGPEFEFYVFDQVRFHQGAQSAFYQLESAEASWNGVEDKEGLGFKIPYKRGYHVSPPADRFYNLRSEISSLLAEVGVELKYHHHEVGSAGQHEIETKFGTMFHMADKTMLIKYIIKNHCYKYQKSATFMPKPLFNEPGSGLHVHQFIANDKGSIFFDPKGPARFSQVGLHYIGGLLKHADSLLAFTNPSTNSFKRLVPGFEAPVAGTYSVGNRTACIRIPGYQRNAKTHRLEFRPPDGTMNPYLAFAAMLMAGLDGIKNKIDPGLPFDKDLETLSPKELSDIPHLPVSLDKALDALRADNSYLLQGKVFTEDLIESWLKLKGKEVAEIQVRPTPHEFELYYNL